MKSRYIGGAPLVLAAAIAVWQWSATPVRPAGLARRASFSSTDSQREFLNRYCGACHNDEKMRGGMTLSDLDLEDVGVSADLAEEVIRRLRAGLMPPPLRRLRPSHDEASAFASSLARSIDQAASEQPYSGRPALHRLNRTEYANTIRDLLGVEIDVAVLLPPDNLSHGFDNMSDVLTVSPTLIEAYIRAADKISLQAVGNPAARPITSTYSISRMVSQGRRVPGAPFGTRGGISVVHHFPADGEYVFKLLFYHHPIGPLFGINQGPGEQIELSVDKRRVALLEIDPELRPDGLETAPVKIQAGPHRISAAFIDRFDGPIDDEMRQADQTLVDLTIGAFPGATTLPHLRILSITGPAHVTGISETPSRRKIFTCRPQTEADESPCARQILTPLARRAYRRPVNERDIESLMDFFEAGRSQGGFESGIRTAIQAMIASPEFVFRFERTPDGAAFGENFRITDLELASRLSYFLWSSAPDDRLIETAAQGRLHQPEVLESEVLRMLADPRASALADNFAGQWLHLQNLRDANPDLYIYPDYDKNLAWSMRRETELLFEAVMREDRSILELLTADYTYVDERLARHYGIPNVLGNRFRRVAVEDENRRGLLGQAGILLLTSVANRTSPVKRGKYVMEVLLGTPPPPPPPNVPDLPENSDARTGHVANPRTVRERMEEHRKDPKCAGCHRLMDPIGLSLENFDAVGLWRTKDSGFTIDPSGEMIDGTRLDGPASLRLALLDRSDLFVEAFTKKLLAYGLGRILDYRDMPVVRSIGRQAAAEDYKFSTFVLGVVSSPPFQMRRAE